MDMYELNYDGKKIIDIVGEEKGKPFDTMYTSMEALEKNKRLFIDLFPELDSSLLTIWDHETGRPGYFHK